MARPTPANNPPVDDRTIVEGDIIVTAVADHYAVGHMTADRDTQVSVEWQVKLGEALDRACALAGKKHRVFCTPTQAQVLIDCSRVQQHPSKFVDDH